MAGNAGDMRRRPKYVNGQFVGWEDDYGNSYGNSSTPTPRPTGRTAPALAPAPQPAPRPVAPQPQPQVQPRPQMSMGMAGISSATTVQPSPLDTRLLANETPNINSAGAGRVPAGMGVSNINTGHQGIRQDAYEDQEMVQLKARLAREEFDRRFGMIKSDEPGERSDVSGYDPNQAKAASDAAFARAKDRSGAIARSSLDALNNIIAERGLAGSGYEADAARSVVEQGQGELGEVNRDILAEELDRSYALDDRNYAGNLTKRGQDISARNALLAVLNTGLY